MRQTRALFVIAMLLTFTAAVSIDSVAAKRGDYAYVCTFHPTMKGKITVQ